ETQNSSNDTDRDPCADGDRNTKKVRFKEAIDGEATIWLLILINNRLCLLKISFWGEVLPSLMGILKGFLERMRVILNFWKEM
ncbi:hypothetical protein Goshw_000613, partial [Gossypium schwendimanii]|nr:hypothetical protein [Gossypium schwendimanii]